MAGRVNCTWRRRWTSSGNIRRRAGAWASPPAALRRPKPAPAGRRLSPAGEPARVPVRRARRERRAALPESSTSFWWAAAISRSNGWQRRASTAVESDGFEVLVFLKGEGAITGREFSGRYGEEQMWRLPGRMGEYRIVPERETAWLRVYAPPSLDDFRERLRRAGLAADEVKRVVVDDL